LPIEIISNPWEWCVAVNTGLALPRSLWWGSAISYTNKKWICWELTSDNVVIFWNQVKR